MGYKISGLHSKDPLAPRADAPAPRPDPLETFGNPVDQSNAIREMRTDRARFFAARQSEARKVPPLDVKKLREIMRLTQAEFANYFGFALATLKHWESGNRRPTGSALVLMAVIHEHPRTVLRAVRKLRMNRPGLLAQITTAKSWRAAPGFGERLPPRRPRGPRKRRSAW